MKQLGGDKVGSELLNSLWLQRLPEITGAIFVCVDSLSLEVLSATAYRVYEVYTRPVIVDGDTRQEVDDFRTVVTSLADAVSRLTTA